MAEFLSTSYGPPWGGIQGGGVTATGIDLRSSPHRYLVAVDPGVIPLGSNLRINPNPFGDPNITFLAADTGGAISGNRIDFYDWRGRTRQLGWGTRKVDVQILGSGALAMPARYPALQVDPGVDIQDVSPTLLARLNNFLVQHGATGEVFSGYRTSQQVERGIGFAGDPHTQGLAVDVNVGGRPIAEAFSWVELSAAGLRTGADPRLQPFYKNHSDPAHIDLMDPSGHAVMPGAEPWTQPFDFNAPGVTTLGTADTGGGVFNWFRHLFAADLPPLGGVGSGINDAAHTVTGVGGAVIDTATAIPDFIGRISDPRFWIRVLEIVGGTAMLLVGLVMLARHLGRSEVAAVSPGR